MRAYVNVLHHRVMRCLYCLLLNVTSGDAIAFTSAANVANANTANYEIDNGTS